VLLDNKLPCHIQNVFRNVSEVTEGKDGFDIVSHVLR
jgi:hypothetical protein